MSMRLKFDQNCPSDEAAKRSRASRARVATGLPAKTRSTSPRSMPASAGGVPGRTPATAISPSATGTKPMGLEEHGRLGHQHGEPHVAAMAVVEAALHLGDDADELGLARALLGPGPIGGVELVPVDAVLLLLEIEEDVGFLVGLPEGLEVLENLLLRHGHQGQGLAEESEDQGQSEEPAHWGLQVRGFTDRGGIPSEASVCRFANDDHFEGG